MSSNSPRFRRVAAQKARHIEQQSGLTPYVPYASYLAFLRSCGLAPLQNSGFAAHSAFLARGFRPGIWHLRLLQRIEDQTNRWRWIRLVPVLARFEIRSERPPCVSRLNELRKKGEILKQLRFVRSELHGDLPDVKIGPVLVAGAAQ